MNPTFRENDDLLNSSDSPLFLLRRFVVRRWKNGNRAEGLEDPPLIVEAHFVQVVDRVLTAAIVTYSHLGREKVTRNEVRWIFNADTWLDVEEIVLKPAVITH